MGCVLITGAAGGIGQALVKAFAEAGQSVIGVDREARPEGLPVEHFIQCDLARTVADPEYADDIFAAVRKELDGRPLDALVNNAAVQILGDVETLGREDWRHTLDVNLLAPFLWVQALLRELEIAQGCVLNISSIHARLTKPGFVAYATSKAALTGMTRAMAVDIGGRVRVNAIEPAAIETPMLHAGFEGDMAGFEALSRFHPSGMIGKPEHLAQLACTVVQATGRFLNGAVIGYDGGIGACLLDPAVS